MRVQIGQIAAQCDLVLWVVAGAMFTLVSILIFQSLRDANFVRGGGRVVVSILVALLAVIGLVHEVGLHAPKSPSHDSSTEAKSTISGLLIPYMALALTILVILILIILTQVVRSGRRSCAILRNWRQRLGRLKAERPEITRVGRASIDDTPLSRTGSTHSKALPGSDV